MAIQPLMLFALAVVGLIMAPVFVQTTSSYMESADVLCLLEGARIGGVFSIIYYVLLVGLVVIAIFSSHRAITSSVFRSSRLSILVIIALLGIFWLATPFASAQADSTVCLLRNGSLPMTGDLDMDGHNIIHASTISTSKGDLIWNPSSFHVVMSQAAGTFHETFTVANTSNTPATSHAYVDVRVGGTTSTGDPQYRLTIPGGTSWHIGVDNSQNDIFTVGIGTAVGKDTVLQMTPRTSGMTSGSFFTLSPRDVTLTDSPNNRWTAFSLQTYTVTLEGTTTVRGLMNHARIRQMTVATSGAGITVNKATGLDVVAPAAEALVTLTHTSSLRATSGGVGVNLSGLYVEALTGGTAGNYQILMQNGGKEPPSLADHVGFYATDDAGSAVLGIASETAPAADADETKFSHKLRVRINGATYYIMLTQD